MSIAQSDRATEGRAGGGEGAEGDYDGAITCFRKAVEIDPKNAQNHFFLGNALGNKGQGDKAIACFRQAIELDPKHARAHSNLGAALRDKGQVDEAIACYKKAVALDPKLATAHYRLGNALGDKGQVDEAIACYQKAIDLNPEYAEAHCNLGSALGQQGRFAESLASLQRGHQLGSKMSDWGYPSAAWVRQAELLVALEAKLRAFLKGEFQPKDTAERMGLVFVCRAKKLHHTAARLHADAFAADPKLADDLKGGHRYNAACSAALAAAGQGEDGAKLDAAARAKLRASTLGWLKADLTAWRRLLDSGPPQVRPTIVKILLHWQRDTDLTGIRDKAALAKLPAEEQKAFTQLWADVAALLKKPKEKPK
jgi:Flp pilus assembly protein TadD